MFVYDCGMLSTMARPTDRLEELVDLDVSRLCDSEVRERFVEVRGLIDRLEATAAALLAAVHHPAIPLGDGAASAATWAQAQTGQRVGEARASLEAGLSCETLPLPQKAWAQGEIS